MKRFIAIVLCGVLFLLTLTACGGDNTPAVIQQASLSATSLNVKMGGSGQLSVLNYAGDVTWSSSDTNIAKVSSMGIIEPVSIGSVAVTATLEEGERMTCVVDVQPGASSIQAIAVTSFYSDANDITVNYETGDSVKLKAICAPDVIEKLAWSSSDELIASVDSNGVVTVWGNGIVEITAMAMNGVKGSCKVRVKNVPAGVKPRVIPKVDNVEIPVIENDEGVQNKFKSPVPVTSPSAKTSVIVSDKNVYLEVGESFTLTYAVGNTKADDVTWMSSDKAVAIVTGGRIVAVGCGRAVISAVTGDGAVASCDVAVGKDEIKLMKNEVSEAKK
ncbi:MAG: Ig-like domain-containing protein [Clostridia bacterium]|nr:Ig-like domain-containing protein [Clostridia bacterium]